MHIIIESKYNNKVNMEHIFLQFDFLQQQQLQQQHTMKIIHPKIDNIKFNKKMKAGIIYIK